jgi:hypothetical protein
MADSQPAHRAAYRRWHGSIPLGFVIHHNCGCPACVRPDHLIAVTPADHRKLHAIDKQPRRAKAPAGRRLGPQQPKSRRKRP